MSILKVTRASLKAAQKLPEGWYNAEFIKAERLINKKKTGMNIIPTFKIVDADGDVKEKKTWFFEPNLGLEFIYFWGAISGEDISEYLSLEKELEIGFEDIQEHVNTPLQVEIKHSIYNGAVSDQVSGFLPAGVDPSNMETL